MSKIPDPSATIRPAPERPPAPAASVPEAAPGNPCIVPVFLAIAVGVAAGVIVGAVVWIS